MTKYKRNWVCGVCDQPVIYDKRKETVSCGCGDGITRRIPLLVLELYYTEIKECVRKKQNK